MGAIGNANYSGWWLRLVLCLRLGFLQRTNISPVKLYPKIGSTINLKQQQRSDIA